MHGLGAEVAEARWMVRIPFDALHDAAVHLHQQAASHPAVRAEGAPPRALLAAPDGDHASCHRRPRVGGRAASVRASMSSPLKKNRRRSLPESAPSPALGALAPGGLPDVRATPVPPGRRYGSTRKLASNQAPQLCPLRGLPCKRADRAVNCPLNERTGFATASRRRKTIHRQESKRTS